MNYINEVCTVFQNRCPNVTIMSPDDYRLIAEWEKQEIPLEIVAATINSLCDRICDSSSEIESIRYFHNTIKNNFVSWLQTGAGASHNSGH